MWMGTAYPFADQNYVAQQLKDLSEKSNGDFNKAMIIADQEIEAAMATREDI